MILLFFQARKNTANIHIILSVRSGCLRDGTDKKGKVYINGKKLKSDIYGITKYIDEPGIAEEPLELGKDEYFCLGDNRPVSYDSRYEEVGPVHRSEIIGKVWIRIWPLTKFGKVS